MDRRWLTERSGRERRLLALEAILLALSIAAAVSATSASDWQPFALFLTLLALAVVGQFLSVRTRDVRIAPAFLATALAMALLGPAPAAVIAVTAVLAWSLKAHTAPELIFNNVVAYTTFPVVGALLIEWLDDPRMATGADLSSAVVVFAVYLVANFLNFLLIVGYLCVRDRTSLVEALRRIYWPVAPWGVATAALTAGTVLAYQEIGLLTVALLAILLFTHQSLLQAVVDVERQRDELREQMDELTALHAGVVRVMVETLSMRDEMTARHSAAVARFARATARAAGLSEREQNLVHTAGLLHDVGKFTFPDHTLNSPKLSEEDWALIRSHPQRGAEIVRRVRGYGAVADVILAHHERVDGQGYPRGLRGEDIPVLARIISVADTFDVLTARDSYRDPVAAEAAIAELRRVAGSQLDADLVEVFVDVLQREGMRFGHADNADLEEELMLGRPEGSAEEARRRPAPVVSS
jgi:putative nucleotidyltransferase with HDIG domain